MNLKTLQEHALVIFHPKRKEKLLKEMKQVVY